MAKVLGVGGVFFKSKDTQAIGEWYKTWLGFEINPGFGGSVFFPGSLPEGAYTVWSPFNADTDYFEPSANTYMINLIVDDVAAALAQVKEGGATLVGEPETLEYGEFGWFLDPDGNKVELWKPAAEPPAS